MLSAHLSTVNEKRNKKFTLMEIAALKRIFTGKDNADAIEVAPPQAIDRLSAKAVDPYFEVYDEMISFLKERNLEDKNSSLEVYLFGHHMQVFGTSYAEASQRITDNVLEQSMLTDTLKSIGINATDIHDFRTPAEPNIDDIFYDSQKRIFYRHRRNKFVLKDHIYEY